MLTVKTPEKATMGSACFLLSLICCVTLLAQNNPMTKRRI
jgi:hypothetical protein